MFFWISGRNGRKSTLILYCRFQRVKNHCVCVLFVSTMRVNVRNDHQSHFSQYNQYDDPCFTRIEEGSQIQQSPFQFNLENQSQSINPILPQFALTQVMPWFRKTAIVQSMWHYNSVFSENFGTHQSVSLHLCLIFILHSSFLLGNLHSWQHC